MAAGNETSKSKNSSVKDQDQRRKAVKNILLGGSVIGSSVATANWRKPIVNSVALPAHASTTADVRHQSNSIEDPVSLSYTCDGNDVDVTADGYINLPIAGISIKLVFSWAAVDSLSSYDPSESPPVSVTVVTDAAGTYTHSVNIGYNLNSASVTASLPDYPEAGSVMDEIDILTIGGPPYYCFVPDNPKPE